MRVRFCAGVGLKALLAPIVVLPATSLTAMAAFSYYAARIASISFFLPTMFITRVRL